MDSDEEQQEENPEEKKEMDTEKPFSTCNGFSQKLSNLKVDGNKSNWFITPLLLNQKAADERVIMVKFKDGDERRMVSFN